MNLVEHIMQREKLDIAKELAKTAKENATLRDEIGKRDIELFWLKVAERDLHLTPSGVTDWDAITKTIDERLAHKAEREHCKSELHQLEDRRK